MRSPARKSLKKLAHREDLQIANVMNEPVVGNFLGLNIVHIASRLATLEGEFASQKQELNSLREEVHNLQKPSEGYKLVRNRFMTQFNRYYLGKYDSWDKNIALARNIAAHQSDVKVDATLYLSPGPGRQQRKDPDAFQALYGVQPQLISEISE